MLIRYLTGMGNLALLYEQGMSLFTCSAAQLAKSCQTSLLPSTCLLDFCSRGASHATADLITRTSHTQHSSCHARQFQNLKIG